MDFDIVVGVCIFATSAIAAITSALTLREKVKSFEQPYKAEYDQIKQDVADLKDVNYHQTRAISVMLRHMIDGNDIGALETEYEILQRLIATDHERHQYHL